MATAQNDSTIINQIYKSRKILLEQLDSQRFDTSNYEDFSVSEVNLMAANNQLDMLLIQENNEERGKEKRKIYVKYALDKNIRPATLQEMVDDLFYTEETLSKNDTLLVVVSGKSINDTMINSIHHIWETDKIFIILQPILRLQFNVLKNNLVPPHRILSESEKISIMTKYNVMNDGEFPMLDRTDPVAQAIGIRPGQVCEIQRPSKTAIVGIYYRICI